MAGALDWQSILAMLGQDAGAARPAFGTAATVNRGAPQSVTPTDLSTGLLADNTPLSMGASGISGMLSDPKMAGGLSTGLGLLSKMTSGNPDQQQQQAQQAQQSADAFSQQMAARRQMAMQQMQQQGQQTQHPQQLTPEQQQMLRLYMMRGQ